MGEGSVCHCRVLAMHSKRCKIGLLFWKDWKVGTRLCCWIMFITKREWSFSSQTAILVSISIFWGWYYNCAWRFCKSFNFGVPLFWTTLNLVIDHIEACPLGFWSATQEKRILRFIHQRTISRPSLRVPSSCSAALITCQQNNNLDCHQTADNKTFDLSFQNSAGRIVLEADGSLCDISQLGHCPEKKQGKHLQPEHWLLLLHSLQNHILKYTNYFWRTIFPNDPRWLRNGPRSGWGDF